VQAGLNESRQLSLEVVNGIGFMFRKFFVSLEMRRAPDWIQTFHPHLCRKSDLFKRSSAIARRALIVNR
jgi:hypothetical protein